MDLFRDGIAPFGTQVGPGAEEDFHGEVGAFPHPVDRGVRDDGDPLFVEIGEVAQIVGQDGEGAIVADRADDLLAELRHFGGHVHVGAFPAVGGEQCVEAFLGQRLDRLPVGLIAGRPDRGVDVRKPPHHAVVELRGEVRLNALVVVNLDAPRHDRRIAVDRVDRDFGAVEAKRLLLPGRHRHGVAHHLIEFEDALLARGKDFLFRFPEPKRSETEHVDAEHEFVAVPGDDGGRSLRQHPERAAVEAVDLVQMGRQLLDFTPDGRKDDFHGLHEGEPVSKHQPFDEPVDVLRVGALDRQRQAEQPHLATQLGDGVDLAVVPERGAHLGALVHRDRVRRIAAVAERDRRLVGRIREIGEIGPKRLDVAAHLVDDRAAAERGDVHAPGDLLDGDRGVVGIDVVALTIGARHTGHLKPDRLGFGGERSQDGRTGFGLAQVDHVEAVRGNHLPDAALDALEVLLGAPAHEDVPDRERRDRDDRLPDVVLPEDPFPDFPGNVRLNPGAVAFLLDLARAVRHVAQGDDRAFDVAVSRHTVLAYPGHDRTGVALGAVFPEKTLIGDAGILLRMCRIIAAGHMRARSRVSVPVKSR